MQGQRLSRVNDALRRTLAELIENRIRDPRRGFVTVTRVDTVGDLSYARVYVSVLGSAEQVKESLSVLQNARAFLRGEASRELSLRLMPELRFVLDTSLEESDRLDRLIKRVQSGEIIRDEEEGEA